MKKLLLKLISKILSEERLISIIREKSKALSPDKSLGMLFKIENALYEITGSEAVRYGGGVHPKHKLTDYHDFFLHNIKQGGAVLDIGCGKGELAFDIAAKISGSSVTGIDISPENIEIAQRKYSAKNLVFHEGDALSVLPECKFDFIILSNVLEHIDRRTEFLTALKNKYSPAILLIRVPCFERDWRTPLKKEIGADWKLDKTHFTEHTEESFRNEIEIAGINLLKLEIKWGEIRAITRI